MRRQPADPSAVRGGRDGRPRLPRPSFNSNPNYSVLFAEKGGAKTASQIQTFEDAWTWHQEDEAVFTELVTKGGTVADCLQLGRR